MAKEDKIIYFAYGSNMDLQNLERLNVKIYKLEKAVLNDHMLIFNVINDHIQGAGYANITPHSMAVVEGLLISTDHNSILNLDQYEGYPYLYKKTFLPVVRENQQVEEALVYIGNFIRTKPGLKPTKEHLNHVLKGKDFLSVSYWTRLSDLEVII